MQYETKRRAIYVYTLATEEIKEVLTFTVKDQIVSHGKLAKNAEGELLIIYVQRSKVIIAHNVQKNE